MGRWNRRGESAVDNPFLTTHAHPQVSVLAEDDLINFEGMYATGPGFPLGIRHLGDDERGSLRVADVGEAAHGPLCWVVGVHGGAGATTLAQLLAEAAPAQASRDPHARSARTVTESPQAWPTGYAAATAARVVLVARTSGAGLAAAAAAARQWATGDLGEGVRLLGLVLVDDGPRLRPSQRAAVDQLGGMTPVCWRIGWNETWRELERPALHHAPRAARRTLASVIAHARRPAAAGVRDPSSSPARTTSTPN